MCKGQGSEVKEQEVQVHLVAELLKAQMTEEVIYVGAVLDEVGMCGVHVSVWGSCGCVGFMWMYVCVNVFW